VEGGHATDHRVTSLAGEWPLSAQAPHHGATARGLAVPPLSAGGGRYGRMFERLPAYDPPLGILLALASAMVQEAEPDRPPVPAGEDKDENTSRLASGELRLPAGYTYFGQFVDHDITFDPVSSLTQQNDPHALTDFRTPRFDLDSLYGGGPALQPYLYQADRAQLELGRPLGDGSYDLPRGTDGRALTGDPRNDENLIVSQLHVAFIKFHNAIVRDLEGTARPSMLLERAQQTARWHYQWIVVNDFLRRLVGDDVVDDVLTERRYLTPGLDGGEEQRVVGPRLLFYRWRHRPFMPIEFAVAAYRFGHSMVRPSYLVNSLRPTDRNRFPILTPDCDFSTTAPTTLRDLCGFRPAPDGAGVHWEYFLSLDGRPGPDAEGLPQPSYRIDTEVSNPLGELPPSVVEPRSLLRALTQETIDQQSPPVRDILLGRSLAVRNLVRGARLGLPAGQDVAAAMGIAPLPDDKLVENLHFDPRLLALLELSAQDVVDQLVSGAPLWFYVLREADVLAGGAHLGPVGGRIVAEVLVGLLAADGFSYLSVDPTWQPTLGPVPGWFTLADLVTVAAG
jgi:hypothetical protein